jgi:ketosteroid isomerase-like protein
MTSSRAETSTASSRSRRGRRTILLLAAAVAVAAAGCASPRASGGRAPATWGADRAEILASLRASSDAWNRADLPGHLGIYVDTVTFMTGNGPRPGVQPVQEAFSRTYWRDGRPLQRLDFEQVTIRPLGADAALQTGRFILSGGGRDEQSGWFTLVWIRTTAGWRAVHDHSS